MTTILIDGTNIFTMQHTANPATDNNGNLIGGTQGFLIKMANVCKEIQPLKVIVFFDGAGGSLARREFKKDYKKGRRPRFFAGGRFDLVNEKNYEQNKQWQHETLKQLLDLLPINTITTNGFEADDGIGYLVKHREFFGLGDIVILSSDKDFIQLISDHVKIYHAQLKVLLDADAVHAKHGVMPQHWALYRAISGDPADNIKGCGGVGPVKFKEIFSAMEQELSPDDLIENLSEHKSYSKIWANKSLIEDNYKLIDLKNPMMSMHAKEALEKSIKSFEPKFKKFEFLRKLIDLGITVNFNMFDVFLRLI